MGGIVRSTGSGMGCPDWPKCFGKIIPPSSEKELPANYMDIYLDKRLQKTNRFVKVLNFFGLSKKANEILTHPNYKKNHSFSVKKAYTEYINRLFGVITGIVTLITLVLSVFFFKEHMVLFINSFAGFFMVLLNGFLGSIVVSSNLFEGIVSLHFLLSLIAISFFLNNYIKLNSIKKIIPIKNNVLFNLIFLLLIIQIFIGTLVRESIDFLNLNSSFILSYNTFNALGIEFILHRIISPIILILSIYTYIKTDKKNKLIKRMLLLFVIIIILQYISGIFNSLFNLPTVTQIVHILFSSILYCIGYYFITSNKIKKLSSLR